MLGVGLTAARTTISLPLVIPPLMPPALLVAVVPSTSSSGSLFCEPRRRAPAKPLPNSTPLTAGMANNRWAIRLSAESKKGCPSPSGTPCTRHSMIPPTESRSAAAARSTSSKRAGSVHPPISVRRVSKAMPGGSIFLATTPAATNATVRRAEKWPPPRGSLNPLKRW